jgi:hypothetical protein
LDETVVVLENNNMLYADEFPGNVKKRPKFIEDGLELPVLSAYFLRAKNYSELIINNTSLTDLTGRIIKSDGKWSIVQSHKNNVIKLWGNFSKVTSIYVLPTYKLEN